MDHLFALLPGNGSAGYAPDSRTIAPPGKAGAETAVEDREAGLEKACSEFESLFLNYMLKEMRDTIPKNGLISGGNAESIYTSLMDMQLSQEIAARRSIGLASYFESDLDRKVVAAPSKILSTNNESTDTE